MPKKHEENAIPKDLKTAKTSRVMLIVFIAVIVLIGCFLAGLIPHEMQQRRLAQESQQIRDTLPVVDAMPPKSDDEPIELALPGNSQAWQETALFARTDGYLKSFTHDIGDPVHTNEVLAVLSAPDLDAQVVQDAASLQQAKANVISAQNNYTLAQSTYERYKGLVPSGGVTQEDLDTKETARNQAQAALAGAQAAVDVAAATLQRLQAQQSFETIVAPFNGTLTFRRYYVGALISASADTSAGHELFRVAETDKLRIFTNVPQSYVPLLKPNQKAEFSIPNDPSHPTIGYLARTAGAIDPATRTLTTEVDVDNTNGKLWAGMYGTVTFKIIRDRPSLTIPTSALLYESSGTQVAVVSHQGDQCIVHFRPIKVGRDLGREIEVTDGLVSTDSVVSNPGEKLSDGVLVHVATSPTPPAVPATAGTSVSPTTRSAGL